MMPELALREVSEADIAYRLCNQVVIYSLGFGQYGARPLEYKVMHYGLTRRQEVNSTVLSELNCFYS